MQQTEIYKLNLIEPADEFGPDPLNQNMETVETELQELDGKAGKVVTGSYYGNGSYGQKSPNSLTFDRRPIAVILDKRVLVQGRNSPLNASWQGNTVSWHSNNSADEQCNESGTHYYVAFLE